MKSILAATQERRLRERLRCKERAAFEQTIRGSYQSLYRQLWHLSGGDTEAAADLTQETFVEAWRSLDRFSGRSDIGTWLHTIAVRVWYRAMRERIRSRGTVPLADALATVLADAEASDPAQVAQQGAARTELDIAIRALPPTYRRAVVLFYQDECKYREIAEQENIAVGTVKSRLNTALKLLRERLTSRREELL